MLLQCTWHDSDTVISTFWLNYLLITSCNSESWYRYQCVCGDMLCSLVTIILSRVRMFVCFFRSAESAKSLQHDSVMAGVVTLQMTSFLAVSLLLHHCYCHWWLTGIWFPHTVADSSSLDTSVGQQDAWDTGDHTRQPDGRLKTDGSACRQPWSHSQRCRFYSDYNFFTLQCVLFYKFI